MRALIQRVRGARVEIDGKSQGEIKTGLVIFLGITHDDTCEKAEKLAHKCVNLRIYEDDAGKMNLSCSDAGGSLLIISQFTLYGDTSHGFRPSFIEAARPEQAKPLYDYFVDLCSRSLPVSTGSFGADMQVFLQNDGPVTVMTEVE